MAENFLIDLIASLKKGDSKKQVKEDIKNLGDIKLPLIGTLNKSKTKAQVKQDLSSLNGTVDLTGKVNNKRVAASMKQATAQAQKQVDSKPVEIAFSVKKEKLVNDIKLLAQQNSRLFKDTDMSIKYNSLLDNAEMARNNVQLSTLRTQLGSLRSELKITGNSGLTMTDALKNGLSKVLQLFGSSGVIMQFTKQLRNAWTEAKELDKAMTDLSRVNEGITRSGFPEYLDRVISKTKQLAVAVHDYIDSMTTFSRAGYNLVDSETLADAAIQLEKVGDMSAEAASKSLLSGLQAYEKIDGYGMDQLAEKAQALNDKIDILGNTASISQKDLAEGIQAVGSVMSDANTSVDEFLSLLSAGNRSVQDANKVALAIRTSALRIRGCTVELQEMGETTDDVIESTSTLAEKIKALTNINGSGGVNILEADEETFRSIYDIYNDIAKVYDKMSDKNASALLDLIAGKNRSNQISAILQNMSEANVLLERSLNAAGTASAEYEIYLNSAQAASERFGVAMTETYSNLISGETVKGLTNAGTAVLDFANSWNILEGTLRGFLALGILKGVTTLTVAFKNSALQISNYGSALSAVKDLSTYAQGTEKYADALKALKSSCVDLTDAQLKQVLANSKLEKSQLIEILQLKDLEEEQRDARLAQLGLIQTTETQTTAQGAAAASTFSLSAAIKGLGVSIKTAIMANPVGIAIMALSTAIGVGTSLISKYNQQLEETRQKNIEAATTASENADKLKELYTEYNRLASIQDKTTSEEESFKTVIEDITVALGDKAKALENLTAGTDEYAEALARVTKEEMQSNAVQATIGRKSAEEAFQGNIWSNSKGSKVSVNSNSKGKSLSDEAQKAVAIVSDSLKEFETINRTWKNISWDISSSDPEEALAFYNALVEAREKLVLASENDESLLDTEIYSDMNNAINAISENLDTYIEKRYQEEKLNYLAQNSIPETTEEYKAMESALTDAAGSSVDLQEKFKELLTADFTSLATGVEEVGDAVRSLNDTPVTFTISDHEEAIDNIQSSISTLRSALDSFNQGTLDESAVIDLMQQFPALIPYIDLAAEGFGNLSEGLSTLIAQQPESLIQSLQTLKSSLNTDEERAQVDALINSLQSLSSYGDTGMEAYATSIGSTWSDTANVIQSVTDQFENLAKVQEAVADGLTISTTAAAELAQMYPEILTNAVYAGNGQIQLNEEVVKSILAGDESIINAQITKLEADKAELEARKSAAIAELEIANQVGTAKGQISLETARNKIDLLNQELEAEISKNNQVGQSYAQTAEGMALNTQQLGDYEADVANNMATNMNSASASMADGMAVNSEASQHSLGGIMMKAADAALAVANIATGRTVGNPNAIYSGKSGTNTGGIKKLTSPSRFTSNVSDFVKGDLSLDEFKSGLEIDISAYEQAISNIDSQIEVLKNLQATFRDTANSANGGIGGHNYADKIKDLEKEKDKINSALDDAKGKGSKSAKETKDEYEELFDFFERRVKVLDNALALLKTNLDNVVGSEAKNKLIDAELGVTEEKFKNYSDALNMYTQKANEALSKLPSDIASKIKDGAVDLTTFVGEGNKDVVEAIKDYEQWADKVADCKQELAELRTAIRQLELEKFNNIMEEFSNQFDLREDGKGLISKQIDLLKEAGELIGESFFTTQIDQSKKQLELLEEEKAKLVEQMESAVRSGRVEKASEEWLSMINSLTQVEGNILDCKKSIEEFDNELLQLHWDVFDRIQGQFKDLDSELSNLRGLFDDFKVTDGDAGWSKEGLAQLGLLTQQYELAQYQVQQYNDAIAELEDAYSNGQYSATEYVDKLSELSKGQWDAVNSSEAVKDAIIDLNEARINEEIDAIEKEISAYKELINAQVDALKSAKDLHDYQQMIAEKTKSVTDLERQIAAMRNDDSAATVAKRKLLEEQLAQAKKDLENAQYDHSIEAQEEALNKQLEDYEAQRNAEIEALKASLEEREALIRQSFENVKANAGIVGQEIAYIAAQHGISVSDAIIKPWQNGEYAIASYGGVLSAGTSAFIGSIMGVENEVYMLQAQANATADTLSYMFATRADNLVNELAASYYSEENLNYMTQALHDSLINTLEGGYNISSIQSALDGIATGLNGVASAANNATNAIAAMGAAQRDYNNAVADAPTSGYGDKVPTGLGAITAGTGALNLDKKKKPSGNSSSASSKSFTQYVNRYANGGVVKKNKDNPLNPIAEAMGEDTMVAAKEGEVILNEKQQKMLRDFFLARGGEEKDGMLIMDSRSSSASEISQSMLNDIYDKAENSQVFGETNPELLTRRPEIDRKRVGRDINIHYDSLVNIQGDVNDGARVVKQIETVASKAANDAIKKSWHDFEMTRKYGIY